MHLGKGFHQLLIAAEHCKIASPPTPDANRNHEANVSTGTLEYSRRSKREKFLCEKRKDFCVRRGNFSTSIIEVEIHPLLTQKPRIISRKVASFNTLVINRIDFRHDLCK